MLLLLFFAFVAGIVTILSPCILPILPIVLSGSVGGGKQRPLGIVSGFILSFTFFTLALTAIVKATGLSPDVLRVLAMVIIFSFGLSLVIPQFQLWLEKLTSRLASLTPAAQNQTGFIGGFTIGLSLGLVWAPCVGPILASVITLALTSSVSSAAVLITLAYSLGTAVPMLAIMQGGRALLLRVPWLLRNTTHIQKVFGVVMMMTAIAIFFNVDRRFQTLILQTFPQYGAGLTTFENNSLVQTKLDELSGQEKVERVKGLQTPGTVAPEITGESWLNSEPLSLAQLRGKVVLVDFWTYTCINCVRTFPYLKSWYQQYKDQGFVIVGVHSPEFEFEKSRENVAQAIQDFGITYPVVQDNEFAIWNRYSNRYWPAHYLIDAEGRIRYTHFGEGEYDTTEAAIRALLEEAGQPVASKAAEVVGDQSSRFITHETYLGLARMANFAAQPLPVSVGVQTFRLNSTIPRDSFGYEGVWDLQLEHAQAQANSAIEIEFRASNVFLVITPATDSDKVNVFLDDQSITEGSGKDVLNGVLEADTPRLYEIVRFKDGPSQHRLRLEFLTPGTQVFAFTFG